MTLKWATKDDFSIHLAEKPGELASLSSKFQDNGISLIGFWGDHSVTGKANFHCVPEDPKKFRAFAEREGLNIDEDLAIYINGPDTAGALGEILEELATAGVNIHAIQAVVVHGQFGCFIWVDQKDFDLIAKALG